MPIGASDTRLRKIGANNRTFFMAEHNLPYEHDFAALAAQDERFATYVTRDEQGRCHVDFSDPAAQRALTCAILRSDFGLIVELPADRLVPPVPNRTNYVKFVHLLLRHTRPWMGDETAVMGVDIGLLLLLLLLVQLCLH